MSSPRRLWAIDKILGSSRVPSIIEWEARICSISVEPALGKPKINMGSVVAYPPLPKSLKKSSSHTSIWAWSSASILSMEYLL